MQEKLLQYIDFTRFRELKRAAAASENWQNNRAIYPRENNGIIQDPRGLSDFGQLLRICHRKPHPIVSRSSPACTATSLRVQTIGLQRATFPTWARTSARIYSPLSKRAALRKLPCCVSRVQFRPSVPEHRLPAGVPVINDDASRRAYLRARAVPPSRCCDDFPWSRIKGRPREAIPPGDLARKDYHGISS